jgi:hypothetical protein
MRPDRTNSVKKYGNASRLKKKVPFAPLSPTWRGCNASFLLYHVLSCSSISHFTAIENRNTPMNIWKENITPVIIWHKHWLFEKMKRLPRAGYELIPEWKMFKVPFSKTSAASVVIVVLHGYCLSKCHSIYR